MLAPWATPGRAERRQVPSLGSSAIATMSGRDVQHRLAETQSELERLRAENERLRTLLAFAQGVQAVKSARTDDSRQSSHSSSSISAGEKIALIRSLFGGREDVFALRWENARTGKSGYVPATAGGGTKDGPKAYLPLSDDAIVRHLQGRESIGIYPLLEDDTCRFLAFDFDGKTWQLDALAVLESSADHQVQAALERSRSGEGGHVWIFFSAPVAAGSARRLGALLLREAMTPGRSSTSQATTGSSPTRTSCRRRGSAT